MEESKIFVKCNKIFQHFNFFIDIYILLNINFNFIYFSQIRYRFGCFDEIITTHGKKMRHCNWIRFLRVSETFGPQVGFIFISF